MPSVVRCWFLLPLFETISIRSKGGVTGGIDPLFCVRKTTCGTTQCKREQCDGVPLGRRKMTNYHNCAMSGVFGTSSVG